MKNFACTKCGNKVYFENVLCLRCQSPLGFDPVTLQTVTLQPDDDEAGADGGLFRIVGNEEKLCLLYTSRCV